MNAMDRAWIEVDKESLLNNVRELKRLCGSGCSLMPAVKANAYGHGDDIICHILEEAGIENFCVASADEAVHLRRGGVSGKILVLGYTPPGGLPELIHYNITQTAVDLAHARELSEYCTRAGGMRQAADSVKGPADSAITGLDGAGWKADARLEIHVAVDTGMHRIGIPYDRIGLIEELWGLPGLDVTGLYSHLCVSDGVTKEERAYTEEQIRRFLKVADRLRRRGISGFATHIQGSYGILNYPGYSFDLARPGIALYGVKSSPDDKIREDVDLRPVLSLKARIACVKELAAGESAGYGLTYTAKSGRRIAIVTAGYADGIPRSLSNRGFALVRGRKVPIAGRICMDQLTLDVTDVPDAAAGDEAVFIGRSCADERGTDRRAAESRITAGEMAESAGTITNELLSRLGGRLRRVEVP